MGLPVVTVASGGLPVVDCTSTSKIGSPVTEAANKFGVAVTKVASGGMPVCYDGGPSSQTLQFLARTSGLDATHTSAYTALIDGLVADGVWSKFDVLYIYATQNTATAQLNLISSSYPATLNGAPAFTVDRGYTGVNASTTVYINSGFNPTTAGSPQYSLNSAHISAWGVTNTETDYGVMGARAANSCMAQLIPLYVDNRIYFALNAINTLQVSNSDARGYWICNRTDANNIQAYKNGASFGTSASSVNSLINLNYYVLAFNDNGTIRGAGNQLAMASIGSSLSATDATNFYNRLRTYMSVVGVP
jgi:hypothetical protein